MIEASVDKKGQSALHHAARHGQRRCGVLLLAPNPVRGSIVRGVTNTGVSIDVRRNDGATPLMLASRHGHLKFVRMLLHRGAATEIEVTYTGETALLLACANGHIRCAETLLDARHCSYRRVRAGLTTSNDRDNVSQAAQDTTRHSCKVFQGTIKSLSTVQVCVPCHALTT